MDCIGILRGLQYRDYTGLGFRDIAEIFRDNIPIAV